MNLNRKAKAALWAMLGGIAVIGIALISALAPSVSSSHGWGAPGCSDSDGGINYAVFGTISGNSANGAPYHYHDQCSSNRIRLWERYCNGISPAVQSYNCPYGCSSGRCNPAPTSTQCNDGLDNDGDGKIDYGFTQTSDSKCSSTSDNDESPRDNCADTDGGFVPGVFGTVSGDDESIPYSFADVCIDASLLREYYCGSKWDDYRPLNYTQNCTTTNNQTNGTSGSCMNGACV